MTPEVQAAIEEIKATFPHHRVEVDDEAQGGAFVVVRDLDVGPTYEPNSTWIGFQIGFQYPYGDIYPLFIDAAVRRSNHQPLGEGFSGSTWRERPATMISRRTQRWNPVEDTAALKLAKVLDWLRTQ